MLRKRINYRDLTGQKGINLIEEILLEMGFIWRPTSLHDAGIDGEIEIRDPVSEEVSNCIIKVQSKATSGKFTAESDTGFEYICQPNDLDYWLGGNVPVILIISRPYMKEAYWICVGDYFKDSLRRKERRIHFDKKANRFNSTQREVLARIAVPKNSGLYFPPPLEKETIFTNLLEVSHFSDTIYWASTDLRKSEGFWARAKENDIKQPENEWVLTEKAIISFHDLRENPWNIFCDRGTIETFGAEEWAYSDDKDKRRYFVQLLNKCLDKKLRSWGVGFRKESDCYYVWATKDLKPRTFYYRSIEQKTSRELFGPYESKTTKDRVAYYRHSAFKGQFVCFDKNWYLEINPTYVFTSNGYDESKFAAERLSGIKKMEKNDAVLGQVIMWGRFLTYGTLFKPEYKLLKFGKLLNFDCNVHIDDKLWLERNDPDAEGLDEDNEVVRGLFT